MKGVDRPAGRGLCPRPGGRGQGSEAGTLPSGLGIPQLLEAVLKLLPLDTYVESPVRTLITVLPPHCSGLSFPLARPQRATCLGGEYVPKGP